MARLLIGMMLSMACWSCQPRAGSYLEALQSPDPGCRIRAIAAVAAERNHDAVPHLVDRLEDEDEAVRFYAILGLEKIEGTRLGYDYGQNDVERVKAVKRWRNYVRQGRHRATASAHPQANGDHAKLLLRKSEPLHRNEKARTNNEDEL